MPYIAQVAVGRRDCLQVYGSDFPTKDGTGVRDYIHIVDLAEGHVKALDKLRNIAETGFFAYNLGTGVGYSVLEMVHAFQKASGRNINYKLVDRRSGDVATCYADASLAEKALGWKATRGVDEMCVDTWRWQSNNPNGYAIKWFTNCICFYAFFAISHILNETFFKQMYYFMFIFFLFSVVFLFVLCVYECFLPKMEIIVQMMKIEKKWYIFFKCIRFIAFVCFLCFFPSFFFLLLCVANIHKT